MFSYDKESIMRTILDVMGKNFNEVLINYWTVIEGDEEEPFATDDCFCNFVYEDDNCLVDTPYGSCETAAGATRFVIIPEDADFVIKLPITGIYEEALQSFQREVHNYCYANDVEFEFKDDCEHIVILDNCGDETDDQVLETIERMIDRLHDREDYEIVAHSTEDSLSPFEEEDYLYNSADDDIKTFILPNIYIGDLNGVPVYIQQKAETLDFIGRRPVSKEEKISLNFNRVMINSSKDKVDEWYCPVNDEFACDLIKFYGEELATKMIAFLRERNDMHSANVGYIEKKPVLIDYGGFTKTDDYFDWR